MWKILGDILTAVVILIITVFVAAIGATLWAIHKHMMKDE
jgi:hypothetical protein